MSYSGTRSPSSPAPARASAARWRGSWRRRAHAWHFGHQCRGPRATTRSAACGNAEVRTLRARRIEARAGVRSRRRREARFRHRAFRLQQRRRHVDCARSSTCTIEEIEWQLGINLWGVIYGTKAFLPMMLGAARRLHRQHLQRLRARRVADARRPTTSPSSACADSPNACGASSRALACGPSPCIRAASAPTSTRRAAWAATPATTNASSSTTVGSLLVTPPEQCAADILRGVERGAKRILTGKSSRLVELASRSLPRSLPGVLCQAASASDRQTTERTAWRTSTSPASP